MYRTSHSPPQLDPAVQETRPLTGAPSNRAPLITPATRKRPGIIGSECKYTLHHPLRLPRIANAHAASPAMPYTSNNPHMPLPGSGQSRRQHRKAARNSQTQSKLVAAGWRQHGCSRTQPHGAPPEPAIPMAKECRNQSYPRPQLRGSANHGAVRDTEPQCRSTAKEQCKRHSLQQQNADEARLRVN